MQLRYAKKGVNDRVDVIVCILVSSQVSRHQLRSLCSMRHSSHFVFTKYHTECCTAPYQRLRCPLCMRKDNMENAYKSTVCCWLGMPSIKQCLYRGIITGFAVKQYVSFSWVFPPPNKSCSVQRVTGRVCLELISLHCQSNGWTTFRVNYAFHSKFISTDHVSR